MVKILANPCLVPPREQTKPLFPQQGGLPKSTQLPRQAHPQRHMVSTWYVLASLQFISLTKPPHLTHAYILNPRPFSSFSFDTGFTAMILLTWYSNVYVSFWNPWVWTGIWDLSSASFLTRQRNEPVSMNWLSFFFQGSFSKQTFSPLKFDTSDFTN